MLSNFLRLCFNAWTEWTESTSCLWAKLAASRLSCNCYTWGLVNTKYWGSQILPRLNPAQRGIKEAILLLRGVYTASVFGAITQMDPFFRPWLRGFLPSRWSGAIADGKTDTKTDAKNASEDGPLRGYAIATQQSSAILVFCHISLKKGHRASVTCGFSKDFSRETRYLKKNHFDVSKSSLFHF
jgi:hypothetical protein